MYGHRVRGATNSQGRASAGLALESVSWKPAPKCLTCLWLEWGFRMLDGKLSLCSNLFHSGSKASIHHHLVISLILSALRQISLAAPSPCVVFLTCSIWVIIQEEQVNAPILAPSPNNQDGRSVEIMNSCAFAKGVTLNNLKDAGW